MPPKKSASKSSAEIEFGETISVGAIPGRGSSHKYDIVIEKAASLEKGEALPFQAPSTSSLQRLKKRLADMGYGLTTRANENGEGVTAFVTNIAGPNPSK